MPSDAEYPDGFLAGRVHLYQPRSGHRAGLDAAFLQACIPAEASGHLIDFGSGCGAVAMAAAIIAVSVCRTFFFIAWNGNAGLAPPST